MSTFLSSSSPSLERYPCQRLQDYKDGEIVLVSEDDLNILLQDSPQRAIGTLGLNGCTAIVVVSSSAVIMAHISPLPGPFIDWQYVDQQNCRRGSEQHHADSFVRILEEFDRYREYFAKDCAIWVVTSTQPDLHIQAQLNSLISTLGIPEHHGVYDEVNEGNHQYSRSPKGELIAVKSANGIELHLEGRKLLPEQN